MLSHRNSLVIADRVSTMGRFNNNFLNFEISVSKNMNTTNIFYK